MPEPELTDAALLQRFLPYLQYDSLESFRSDSAAILPEYFFDDGSSQSYTNTLKRAKRGDVVPGPRGSSAAAYTPCAPLESPPFVARCGR